MNPVTAAQHPALRGAQKKRDRLKKPIPCNYEVTVRLSTHLGKDRPNLVACIDVDHVHRTLLLQKDALVKRVGKKLSTLFCEKNTKKAAWAPG
mgnify:CR=1 FL=1